MLLLLPFLLRSNQKLRTWGALMAASLTSWLAWDLYSFLAIDIAANLVGAWLVMKHPKTDWQRWIGALFLVMALYSIGFSVVVYGSAFGYFSDVLPEAEILRSRLSELGWAQLALLIGWGAYDLLGRYWPGSRSLLRRSSVSDRRIR